MRYNRASVSVSSHVVDVPGSMSIIAHVGWCGASTLFRVNGGDVAYDHSGKQAEYAPFSYSGPS